MDVSAAAARVAATAGVAQRARCRRPSWVRRGWVGLLCAALHWTAHAWPCAGTWPAWDRFKLQFISADGRVIDTATVPRHSTSEGQSYALFFALAANDRDAFSRVLRWTEDNLAAGDLLARLPGWQWGHHNDGSWRLLDANTASDADLWMAFTLLEASRLWHEPRYEALARAQLALILRDEVAVLPGLGPVLLPGTQGFGPDVQAGRLTARLNPSYLPLPVLRRLAALTQPAEATATWQALLASSLQVLAAAGSSGIAPDWLVYSVEVPPDTEVSRSRSPATTAAATLTWPEAPEQRFGSYDAIRVYLWLGMTAAQDPDRAALLQRYAPMAERIERAGVPPERVAPDESAPSTDGPPGFSAATLPFLLALQRGKAAARQRERLAQRLSQRPSRAAPPPQARYYDEVLTLFGQGFVDRRFRFTKDGALVPAWSSCNVH